MTRSRLPQNQPMSTTTQGRSYELIAVLSSVRSIRDPLAAVKSDGSCFVSRLRTSPRPNSRPAASGAPAYRPRAAGADPPDRSREPTLGKHAHPRRTPAPQLRGQQLDHPALPGDSRRSVQTTLVHLLPQPPAISRRSAPPGCDRKPSPGAHLGRFTTATMEPESPARRQAEHGLRASRLGRLRGTLAEPLYRARPPSRRLNARGDDC